MAPTAKHPVMIVVTGIQAAGKSTVARRLAQRRQRGVHIEADVLQHMIVSGAAGVTAPGDPTGEAAEQLRLRLKNMCLLGRSFYEAGFTVVLDDIIIGARWEHLQQDLAGVPFSLVVLAPARSVVLQRDRARDQGTLGEGWARHLDEALQATMAGVGLWIDNSQQTPEETVTEISEKLRL